MESSRGLVASIAALGLVVAAAITLLVISGAPLDFRDWPDSPKPRPAPGGQVGVLGERADSGGASDVPALVQLDTSAPQLAAGGTPDAAPGRPRVRPVSNVSPRPRERFPFRRGHRNPTDGQPPPPAPPPAPVTPPSVPVSAPVRSPEPPWYRHWEERAKVNRPDPEKPEKPEKPKPEPRPQPEPEPEPEPKPEPEPEPKPKPKPEPDPPPALPPAYEPDPGEEKKGEKKRKRGDGPDYGAAVGRKSRVGRRSRGKRD